MACSDALRRTVLVIAVCAALAANGCGRGKSGRLVDYLDELEFDVPLETAAYVSLGRFDIPIAATRKALGGSSFVKEIGEGGTVWMRLQFELTAETTPADEKAVLEAAQQHRGALNDAVLTVVRTSSVEELADPRLGAMNARLSEIARPLLGEERVRQLVFNNPQSAASDSLKGNKDAGHGDKGHGHDSHGEGDHGDAHGGGQVAENSGGGHGHH